MISRLKPLYPGGYVRVWILLRNFRAHTLRSQRLHPSLGILFHDFRTRTARPQRLHIYIPGTWYELGAQFFHDSGTQADISQAVTGHCIAYLLFTAIHCCSISVSWFSSHRACIFLGRRRVKITVSREEHINTCAFGFKKSFLSGLES